jgi:hypothetical protein
MTKSSFKLQVICSAFFTVLMSSSAMATNFKCNSDTAAACKKLCASGGGSWSDTDNSCCDAARAASRPVWPSMEALELMYPAPANVVGDTSSTTGKPVLTTNPKK